MSLLCVGAVARLRLRVLSLDCLRNMEENEQDNKFFTLYFAALSEFLGDPPHFLFLKKSH